MLWARDSRQKRGLVEVAGGTAASPTPRMDVGGAMPPAGLPGHWALRQRCDCSLSGSRQGRRRASTRCSPKQVALLQNPRDRRGLSYPAWGWAWGRSLLHPVSTTDWGLLWPHQSPSFSGLQPGWGRESPSWQAPGAGSGKPQSGTGQDWTVPARGDGKVGG